MTLHLKIASLCPYPTVRRDGTLRDGVVHAQPPSCITCVDKNCHLIPSATPDTRHVGHCRHGLLVITLVVGKRKVRINGIAKSEAQADGPNASGVYVNPNEIWAWRNYIEQAAPQIEEMLLRVSKDALVGLHDVKGVVGTILRTAEGLIFKETGTTFDEKLQGCPRELRSIYDSIRFLTLILQLVDIVANPSAIRYGKLDGRRISSIFKMFENICADRIDARKLHVWYSLAAPQTTPVFVSFNLLLFIFFDNAIKYSAEGSTIFVESRVMPNGDVQIDVKSNGAIIPVEERRRIFERGFRGSNAGSPDGGSGVGLFVAQQIAQAHNSVIHYSALEHSTNPGFGQNCFSIVASRAVS